jgi:hypothetical protein
MKRTLSTSSDPTNKRSKTVQSIFGKVFFCSSSLELVQVVGWPRNARNADHCVYARTLKVEFHPFFNEYTREGNIYKSASKKFKCDDILENKDIEFKRNRGKKYTLIQHLGNYYLENRETGYLLNLVPEDARINVLK